MFVSLQGQNVDSGEPIAPTPPNIVKHNGETYVLHKSSSVRKSIEALPALINDEKNPVNSVQVVSESILDLESLQKSTVCEVRVHELDVNFCRVSSLPRQVSCVDYASDDKWNAFLADCDQLTSELYITAGDEGADAKSLGLDID